MHPARFGERASGPLEIRVMNDPARSQRVSPRPRINYLMAMAMNIFPPSWRAMDPSARSSTRAVTLDLRARDGMTEISQEQKVTGSMMGRVNVANSLLIRGSLTMDPADPESAEIAANRGQAWRNGQAIAKNSDRALLPTLSPSFFI